MKQWRCGKKIRSVLGTWRCLAAGLVRQELNVSVGGAGGTDVRR